MSRVDIVPHYDSCPSYVGTDETSTFLRCCVPSTSRTSRVVHPLDGSWWKTVNEKGPVVREVVSPVRDESNHRNGVGQVPSERNFRTTDSLLLGQSEVPESSPTS